MPKLMEPPPFSAVEPVSEVLHGVTISDRYRWLEDQDSAQTRAWLEAQTEYARAYLDAIPGRKRVHERIRELLDVETYDSIQQVGQRYFFRKRLPGQEQHCIFLREGADGKDCLLIDPAERGTGEHTAVKPLRVSPNGQLLLYEVKEGGERTGTFELLDIQNRKILPDVLPRGYLRGFAFAPDSRSFYYVHEAITPKPQSRAVFHHILGTRFDDDKQILFAGDGDKLRLSIVTGKEQLGFLVCRFLDKPYTDFHLWRFGSETSPTLLIENAGYKFGPMFMKDGRILAITDRDAPNLRIVRLRLQEGQEPEFVDVIPATDVPIQNLTVTESRIFVSYTREIKTQIAVFDLFGKPLGELTINKGETGRLAGSSSDEDELFFERESFTQPIQIYRYSPRTGEAKLWAERRVPFSSEVFSHSQVWFTARDKTRIPMFLVGRRDVLESGQHPTIMTSYGGYGVPMTAQFSVFVAFLIERGCLFALPNIRGGSEFGAEWHDAAKRRNRQVAFDDFLCAAEWMIESGRTEPQKLAIFGGSNSGLLVGAAITQRPDLFRAVVCMVPILDMLRYHLFDNAHIWKEEFGTADDPDDFTVLLGYSPYHRVGEGVSYPATMIVSGDADQNCNPLHARKMIARLQAANVSEHPIFLDYSRHRGHSPVLPLTERIEALTDRMAFLCDQLQLPV
jgi:prolyl oligopeptidase